MPGERIAGLVLTSLVVACNTGAGTAQNATAPASAASSDSASESTPSVNDAGPAPEATVTPPAATAEAHLAAPPTLEPGCKPANPGDSYWDYPDRIQAAHIQLKQTPATALRGYLFWTSSTEACLRVDLRTVDAETAGVRPGQPMVLGVRLSDNDSLRAVEKRPMMYFDHPLPSTVYSISTRVQCGGARSQCRTVRVFVEHPWAGDVVGIGIELKDAK